jgi:hypothetical protein
MVIWKTLVVAAIAAPVIGFAALAEEARDATDGRLSAGLRDGDDRCQNEAG